MLAGVRPASWAKNSPILFFNDPLLKRWLE